MHDKNSIFVVVNAVAEISFTPFTNTSALVPFHLKAIFNVSVDGVVKIINEPATTFCSDNLVEAEDAVRITNALFGAVILSPRNKFIAVLSLTYATFPLNSTNQVPPLDVIKPLV